MRDVGLCVTRGGLHVCVLVVCCVGVVLLRIRALRGCSGAVVSRRNAGRLTVPDSSRPFNAKRQARGQKTN